MALRYRSSRHYESRRTDARGLLRPLQVERRFQSSATGGIEAFVNAYLSPRDRSNPGRGCLIAAVDDLNRWQRTGTRRHDETTCCRTTQPRSEKIEIASQDRSKNGQTTECAANLQFA